MPASECVCVCVCACVCDCDCVLACEGGGGSPLDDSNVITAPASCVWEREGRWFLVILRVLQSIIAESSLPAGGQLEMFSPVMERH